MAQYTTTPTVVTALQFDGTLNSVAPLTGTVSSVIGQDGALLIEGIRGRMRAQVGDWVVKIPTTTSDLFDESTDAVLSVVPAAQFAATYTYSGP